MTAAVAGVLALPALGHAQAPPPNPVDPVTHKGDQYMPKPAGTQEDVRFYFGPYEIPPGHDMNRYDLNLPLREGFVQSIEPALLNASDMSSPTHEQAHIHHAHWLRLQPGHKEDNHTYGFTRWMFGTGDEETKADARPQSNAEANGPVYGGYTAAGKVEPIIYMVHNKTPQPLHVYIALDVTFLHGSAAENEKLTGRPHRDPIGVIFGRTYNAPRDAGGDGTHQTAHDDPQGPIEWTSTVDGTLIGMGGHLHPGGLRVEMENLGSEQSPCANTGGAYGGTKLFESDAVWRHARYSTDFQMTVSQGAWRAPIRKGDRIRLNGVYENRDNSWYDVMTHTGLFIDTESPPGPGCAPYLLGATEPKPRKLKRRRGESRRRFARRARRARLRHRRALASFREAPLRGVNNRDWGHHHGEICGEEYGAPACERPEPDRGPGVETSQVRIAGFTYLPGDRGQSGQMGAPARVKQGTSLTFLNADQPLNIRHTVTTCPWPCNGRLVSNYPNGDGVWDSGTMGYDVVDGGSPSPVASTPKDLPVGKYSYYCRIHPWMRGAFEVTE